MRWLGFPIRRRPLWTCRGRSFLPSVPPPVYGSWFSASETAKQSAEKHEAAGMEKKPEEKPKAGLLAVGLLTAFFILDFALAVAGVRSRRFVGRSFVRAAGCTAVLSYMLYQRWKSRKS